MNESTARLEDRLRDWQIAVASNDEDRASRIAHEVYNTVLGENDLLPSLFDERVLSGLVRLIDHDPPNLEVFGSQVAFIRERADRARRVNDLFYRVLDPGREADDVSAVLSEVLGISESAASDLLHSEGLGQVRQQLSRPASDRLTTFLEQLSHGLGADSEQLLGDLRSCHEALKEREEAGTAHSLLVHRSAEEGIVLPISAKVQRGSGQVKTVTPAAEDFSKAIERARLAMVAKNFIGSSDDVVVTSALTEAQYSGGSGALASAMAIFSSIRSHPLDAYTAFSGNINLRDNQWAIQRVDGVEAKLRAAIDAGCRRVFLPKDNESDVPDEVRDHLQVVCVTDIAEVLAMLLLPTIAAQGDTLADHKIRMLEGIAIEQGWQLSGPKAIEHGQQFVLAPASPPSLTVNVYQSGNHSPKRHDHPAFQRVLDMLASVQSESIRPRPVQQVFDLRSDQLRREVQEAFESLSPTGAKDEQYCEYSLRFEDGAERLVVKQYESGKLQIQGHAGQLYQRVLEAIIPRYNLENPSANLSVEQFMETADGEPLAKRESGPTGRAEEDVQSLPYIGTDESGKGDYFGPLVTAAVWLDEETEAMLRELGIRDSKDLSDRRCRELATLIRRLCPGRFEEVEISPERYNSLYEEFRREGKNLNYLLAWGHARALETILERHAAENAIADQFGNEKYIESKLMERGKRLSLVQTPKAERYLAVAAASILARDRFLARLSQLGADAGVALPKGASAAVVEAAQRVVQEQGKQALMRLAKLHFKTTAVVLERSRPAARQAR